MSFRWTPPNSPSTSTGIWTESQSCTSWGVNWKYQRIFPVSASTATTEDAYRLSPRRTSPFPVGGGIPCAPVDEIQFRIVGAGDPGRRSALFPRVAGPGLVPRFAGTRNGVEPPGPLAGGGVVGVQKSPDAVFTARDAHDDLVLHGQRSHRDAVALAVFGHLRLPRRRRPSWRPGPRVGRPAYPGRPGRSKWPFPGSLARSRR